MVEMVLAASADPNSTVEYHDHLTAIDLAAKFHPNIFQRGADVNPYLNHLNREGFLLQPRKET